MTELRKQVCAEHIRRSSDEVICIGVIGSVVVKCEGIPVLSPACCISVHSRESVRVRPYQDMHTVHVCALTHKQ